jgi:hypothetical protein
MPLGFDALIYLLLRRWLLVLIEPAHDRVWSRDWCMSSSSVKGNRVAHGFAPVTTNSDDEVSPEAEESRRSWVISDQRCQHTCGRYAD